ncbi:alginate export family protein [Algihabitans albus]|uniref:alginate export family protein n=1 Tax=Algihabitans albus TaxID=2164067 RepID=UPI0035D0A69D
MFRSLVSLGLFTLLVAPLPGLADTRCETGFAKLRYQDDISCHRDAAPVDALDRLKFIPLDRAGGVSLSLGGDVRQRYEYTQDPGFGADPQDESGVWLQRYILHGDLELGPTFRVFGQIFSALESGRAGGPSPVDENELALQNAFLDVRLPLMAQGQLTLRGGRQELDYGSGRLVDVREGPNVRRTFDAGRLIAELPDWRLDALLARPRAVEQGRFDDESDGDRALWGLYATGGRTLLPLGSLDLYYLGFHDREGSFQQGTEDEKRHSVGVRFWGERGGWDWNWEGLYQFGSFGSGDIRAWTLASQTGYTWSDWIWQPRLALSANIASGDDDPGDADLGTFNALFPRGNYFSEAAVLGPRNFFNLHGFLTVVPFQELSLTGDFNAFWRLETEDGVYSPSGQLIRASGGSDERFVGSAVSLTAEYAVSHRLDLTAIYTRFFTGDFIEETGESEDIDFLELTARFRF